MMFTISPTGISQMTQWMQSISHQERELSQEKKEQVISEVKKLIDQDQF